jgi:hypothetical protein
VRSYRAEHAPGRILAAHRKEIAMPNQEQSKDGIPRKDGDRPSPDVDYRGDGPAKVGITSDKQPDLVAPSGVNERDHGAADDKPMGGGAVNLDDDDMAYPRGKATGNNGGTWEAEGGDSAPLGPPGAGLSNRNGPSDPDAKKQ